MRLQLLVTVLLCAFLAAGQKNFEGTIRYNISAFEDIKGEPGELHISFGKPGIRLEFVSSTKPPTSHEVIIVNFDSGMLVTVKPASKTFASSPLTQQTSMPTVTSKTVAGFQTKPVLLQPSRVFKDGSGLFSAAVLYTADSLFYTIPVRFAGNPELMMVQNDRIGLEGNFYSKSYSRQSNPQNYPMPVLKDTVLLFQATAYQVLQQPIPDSFFWPGADYKQQLTGWSDETESVDSVAIIDQLAVDTAVTKSRHSRPETKSKKPQKKKLPSTKNPVYRKEN